MRGLAAFISVLSPAFEMNPTISPEEVKYDCRFFRGHIPCQPNKDFGVMCNACSHYTPKGFRILIIKLGAIGDVIRTTPLLERLEKVYPNSYISWLTRSPDVLPKNRIGRIYRYDETSLFVLQNQEFELAINLDKDEEACILLSQVRAKTKYGFSWQDGHIVAADAAAEHKLLTGLFDNLSKANTKSYLEEIFEICHLDFQKEEYILEVKPDLDALWKGKLQDLAKGKKIIGLNTGCGLRWQTRLWKPHNWVALIEKIQAAGHFPLLLGGKDEEVQNQIYAQSTGATYLGCFSLPEFIAISNQCDVIVSAVTMMMHLAIGLKKPLLLFNNIFNPYEFELYGRGQIIEPTSGCDCYYGNRCQREKSCMDDIAVETVVDALQKWV